MMSTEPPQHPSKYVMLDENQHLVPPPQRRNLPRYHHPHSKSSSGNCCLKFICCCCCCLFFLIFLCAICAYILYALYKPRAPSYKVEKFEVASFEVLPDFSFQDEFLVTVKADNPNQGIGFIYEEDSEVSILYKDKTLCSGQIPTFEQPEKNVSMIKIGLKGKSKFGSAVQDSLMADDKADKVPLLIKVKAPITVVLGDWPIRRVLVKLNCSLTVDKLMSGKQMKIFSAKYDYEVMF